MEDAVAEEVLLALGPRLTWEQTDEHHWDSNRFEQGADDEMLGVWGAYTIIAEPKRKRFAVHLDVAKEIDWNPRFLTSLAAACAACEFHHATGEWK